VLAEKDRLVIQARVDALQDRMNESMQDEKNHHAEYVLCWWDMLVALVVVVVAVVVFVMLLSNQLYDYIV
jgi:cytochrome oxidase assembly protein ShyY1